MILAKEEVIVNEWEYATSKNKNAVSKHSLVVTNKRIVSSVKSKRKITQREIPVSSVQNVFLSHEVPSKFCAIFSIIIGIILMVAGVCFGMGLVPVLNELIPMFYEIVNLVIGAVALIFGLILLIRGILRLNQGAFSIVLTTNSLPEYELMSVGFEKFYGKRKVSSAFKFKIKNEIAKEIIDTIGAVILDNK